VLYIRNYGLILGLELESIPGKPGARGYEVYLKCFERGILVRQTGDILALSPSLIIEKPHIDELFGTLASVLKS
jgi:beta-alanine--pyruvate transaminase